MLYFRTDSNSTISEGHIMRCIAIAKEWVERNEQVCFLIADENPIPVLEELSIPYIILHSDWKDLMSDVEQVKEILINEDKPVLLVDTYQISKEYVDRLKPYCKLAYLGSKREFLGELDLLINYSTDIDYGFYLSNYDEHTTLLLGPSYAPLRKEFQNENHSYRDRIKRILITTGNTDKNHMVSSIVEGLLPIISKNEIKLDVVIGRLFDDKEKLHTKYDMNPRIILHENVKSMYLLMKDCDLAISANGTTVYELSAMGLPIISFAMVEEQVRSAESLSELGVIDYCGQSYEDLSMCIVQIMKRVVYYLENNNMLIELAQKAHALIDGNGCQKIVNALALDIIN